MTTASQAVYPGSIPGVRILLRRAASIGSAAPPALTSLGWVITVRNKEGNHLIERLPFEDLSGP